MSSPRPGLAALFARFLRFGLLAWGGPVAQIGMIERELVEEERWIEPARFNRLLAVYQVLPGPEAHELCVHLGMLRGGRLGGILAGLGFMLPGVLLILSLAWLYSLIDLSQPPLATIFLGVQVAVVAIIVRAVHRIGGHVLADRWLWLVAALAAMAAALGAPFWISLPAGGIAYALLATRKIAAGLLVLAVAATLAVLLGSGGPDPVPTALPGGDVTAGSVGPLTLFLSGLKAGLLTFGGAYTAIPFVRDDAVGRGWVTEGQFLDGLALSGIIPAPLIIFATFVGYQAGGLAGGAAITVGIFLPAFSFALLFFDRLERVIEDARLHRFLEGVAGGVVGLISVTTVQLGLGVAGSAPSLGIAALIFSGSLALLYLWRSKLNLPAAVIGSAVVGLLFVVADK
ncbi:MAG TPA: chromate efflux transporter [Sphingomicrobium sp.]|nr:chromate efflux transporter [Sphingomicrobium sp.]